MLFNNSIEEFKNRTDYAPREHTMGNQALEIVEIDRKVASKLENSGEDMDIEITILKLGLKLAKLLLEAIL